MNWTTSTDKLQTMLNIEMSWKDTNRRWLSVFHGINCIFVFQCSSLCFFFFFFFRLWFCSTFFLHLRFYFSVTISSYSYFGSFGRYVFFLDTVRSDFMNFDTQSHIKDRSFNLNRTKNDNYYYSPWKLSSNNHFKFI